MSSLVEMTSLNLGTGRSTGRGQQPADGKGLVTGPASMQHVRASRACGRGPVVAMTAQRLLPPGDSRASMRCLVRLVGNGCHGKSAEAKISWISSWMQTATFMFTALKLEGFPSSVSFFFCSAFTVSSLSWSTLPKDTLYKKAIERSLYSENICKFCQMLLRSHSLPWKTCFWWA